MRQRHALLSAGRRIHVEPELLALGELHRPLGERTQPQLWALQVHQDGDRMPVMLFHRPQQIDALPVIVLRAVAEVQAKDVRAGLEQGAQSFGTRRRRAEGGHDLGETRATHKCTLALRRRHFEVSGLLVDLDHGGVVETAPAGARRGEEQLVRG